MLIAGVRPDGAGGVETQAGLAFGRDQIDDLVPGSHLAHLDTRSGHDAVLFQVGQQGEVALALYR